MRSRLLHFARSATALARLVLRVRASFLAGLFMAALAPWLAAGCESASHGNSVSETAQAASSDGRRASIGFRTHALLIEHFEKHGREFGEIDMAEYLRRAQSLRDRRVGGGVLEIVRTDEVVTRFDRASGAFIAFDHDGVIRTFFKPRQGETYFRRQSRRRGSSR